MARVRYTKHSLVKPPIFQYPYSLQAAASAPASWCSVHFKLRVKLLLWSSHKLITNIQTSILNSAFSKGPSLGMSYYVNFLKGLGSNEFHIKGRFGTHGSWKNQNLGGLFGATSSHFLYRFLEGKKTTRSQLSVPGLREIHRNLKQEKKKFSWVLF